MNKTPLVLSLLAILALLSYCSYHVNRVRQTIDQALEARYMTETESDEMVTSWTSGGGVYTHTVRTVPREGETPTQTAKRHADDVAALAAQFKPDPPG